MNVNNLIEAARDDLTILFEELTSPRGVRAVAAWQALCEPDVSYALDDEEAPYEFRHAVGTDIGCGRPHRRAWTRMATSCGMSSTCACMQPSEPTGPRTHCVATCRLRRAGPP